MLRLFVVVGLVLAGGPPLAAAGPGGLTVVSVTPLPHAVDAPPGSQIRVVFDRPVRPASVALLDSFWAFGRWSGTAAGTLDLSPDRRTLIFQPARPFSHGETVTVFLSHDLQADDGSFLRDGGYSFQFWIETKRVAREYFEGQRFSTRSDPGTPTRSYGGLATDVDGDGWLDLSIVNEISADLRVFPNRADGSGTFDDFLTPPAPLGVQASPSEASDFDRDGIADVCTANISPGTVSVLLGVGDGSFVAHQEIFVGGGARGIGVLDADGDGDADIVATSSETGRVALLLNDGAGTFAAPTFFGTGMAGEWAAGMGDVDNDGQLDVVIGAQTSETIYVYTANGDATFSLASTADAGGRVWMLALGDVDHDGDLDVTTVNGASGNAALLLGDGAGGLSPSQLLTPDPFPLATDLGDLDGDGDLDWVTSSFSGDWHVYRNDGGAFAFDQELPAPQAASCALLLDVDNDAGLDLALIDELADEVLVMRNANVFADGFESGDLSAWSAQVP